MAYRFKLRESLGRGLRRIAREEFAEARVQLERAAGDPGRRADAVHGTRRAIKRVRALLRLARPELGEKTFTRENRRYRDMARHLASARDAHVLQATLDGLAAHGTIVGPRAAALLARSLARSRETGPRGEPGILAAMATLAAAERAIAGLRCGKGRSPAAAAGLASSYRAGRAALARARGHSTDETLHELRKTVQMHWRHMQLLSPVWPKLMLARVEAAREVSELLGRHHDLAMLAAFADAELRGRQGKAAARGIVGLCRAQQAALEAVALHGARRLFAERPSGLAGSIEAWWRAAAAMERAARANASRPRAERSAGPAVALAGHPIVNATVSAAAPTAGAPSRLHRKA